MWKLISTIPNFGRRKNTTPSEPAPARIDHRSNDQDVALILIHGFSGKANTTWGDFSEYLLNEPTINSWDIYSVGYASSLRIDLPKLWSADANIDILAQGLKTVLCLPPFDSYSRIAIAAHSMGGLVVQRAILNDTGISNRLSHLFLFGTPSGGLKKARVFARLKRQVRDMVEGSTFIKSLRSDWEQRYKSGTPFAFRAVAGERDEFVPASSSLIPFTDDVRAVVPGNHLEIIRPVDNQDPSLILVIEALNGGTANNSVVDGARVAVELGDFNSAIETLHPRAADLDDNALVSLALALEGIGKGDQALAVLEGQYRGGAMTSTEALGVLAGRVKRRWLVDRVATDWSRARELYLAGFNQAEFDLDHNQAFYHAINVGFLDLLISPPNSSVPSGVRAMAERALFHCQKTDETHWRFATEGEAQLMLGNLDGAIILYDKAISLTNSPREINSMYSQAIRVATRIFGSDGAKQLETLFNP